MSGSAIYCNLRLYRFAMSLLYLGKYRARFERVCEVISPADKAVLELCFGDVVIAERCRRLGKTWVGLDVSEAFVSYAVGRGFDARKQNVAGPEMLPASDVCIMMGSLYHFEGHFADLFRRIKSASSRFILSEPVKNWTHVAGLPGYLARKLTRAGEREEAFRFDEPSLLRTLDALAGEVGFTYRVVDVARDMIVEVVWSS
jgi:hypothetical protein